MSKRLVVCALALAFCCTGLVAQQPNNPGFASMIFAGFDNGMYPLQVNWGSTVIGLEFQGAPGAPYAMVSANNGMVLPAGINVGAAGLVDIDVGGGFTFVINGLAPASFFDNLAFIDPTGFSNWTLPISSNGSLGAQQALVVDTTNPAGVSLTAASVVTVTVQQFLFLAVPGGGDDVFANIPLAFGTTIFYDQTYATLSVNSNGCVTFGGGDVGPFATIPAATTADFDQGYPRMAPLWTDLLPGIAIAQGNFVFSFIENLDGWQAIWTAMDHYTDPTATMAPGAPAGVITNTFSVSYAYNANVTPTNPLGLPGGTVTFDYSLADPAFAPPFPGGVSADWGFVGITPGGTVPAMSPIPAGTSTPLDPAAPTVIDPASAPNTSVGGTGPMGSFRGQFGAGTTQGPLNIGAISGTGAQSYFIPQVFGGGMANSYTFLRNGL